MAELERRKKKAEKEKKRKAKQAAAAKQSFRNKKPEASNSRKDSGYSGNQQQQKQNWPAYNQNKQSSQPNIDRKLDNSKNKKDGGVGRDDYQHQKPPLQVGVGEAILLQPLLETGDIRPMGASLDVSAGAKSKPHSNPSSMPSTHEDHPTSCPPHVQKPQAPIVPQDSCNKQS